MYHPFNITLYYNVNYVKNTNLMIKKHIKTLSAIEKKAYKLYNKPAKQLLWVFMRKGGGDKWLQFLQHQAAHHVEKLKNG